MRRAVGESLRDGAPDLLRVARKLAMSRRTLQRRLREEGLDFKRLVDDTRRRFSLSYLRDRKHTLTEVACLLRLFGSQRLQPRVPAVDGRNALGVPGPALIRAEPAFPAVDLPGARLQNARVYRIR